MSPEYSSKDALALTESDETARTSCCQTNTERRRQTCKRVVWSLLVGQTLALLLAASGTCTALLSHWNFSLPFAQNLPYYLLLLLVYNSTRLSVQFQHNKNRSVLVEHAHLRREPRQSNDSCLNRWVVYVSIGVILVHSIWATMTAYAYTNMTSIQLLDCLGIPTAMLLSFLILRHQYLWTHYVGAVVCIAGAGLMIGADFLAANKAVGPDTNESIINDVKTNVVIGDILALIGGILYGAYSVLQEYAILKYGAVNSLANVSLVTSVLCGFYCATMEHGKLTELLTMHTLSGKVVPAKAGICLAGYVCAAFTLDSLMAFTITWVSAVTINLSLLTADIYGLIVGIFVFQLTFHYSLGLVRLPSTCLFSQLTFMVSSWGYSCSNLRFITFTLLPLHA
ncbi:solute carrier family 35 member F2 [Clonorchis sinensis]|uniref:Solute carrier family 35 member F2 n=1 Tax=Clonorchis sinensis TaxID=79923 RepID=H2KS70_CLOSI|nr:solute carrier family 35 member F2 [Clonorchis sinensis]